MKKKLLVLLVLVTLGTGLYAQQAGQRTFGARLGLARGFWSGLDSMSWSDSTGWWEEWEQSNRFNFNVALYVAYTFTPTISLQAELNFMINQGFTEEWAEGDWWGTWWSDSYNWSYTSLDIPVLLRYNFFHGLLGFLVGPHISIPIAGDDISELNTTFGITVGGQGLFPIGPGRLVGDLRFVADFNRLIDYSYHDPFSGDSFTMRIRRQAVILTVGYEISF